MSKSTNSGAADEAFPDATSIYFPETFPGSNLNSGRGYAGMYGGDDGALPIGIADTVRAGRRMADMGSQGGLDVSDFLPYVEAQAKIRTQYNAEIIRPRQNIWHEAVAMLGDAAVSRVGLDHSLPMSGRVDDKDMQFKGEVTWRFQRLAGVSGRQTQLTTDVSTVLRATWQPEDRPALEAVDAMHYLTGELRFLRGRILGVLPLPWSVEKRRSLVAGLLGQRTLEHATYLSAETRFTDAEGQSRTVAHAVIGKPDEFDADIVDDLRDDRRKRSRAVWNASKDLAQERADYGFRVSPEQFAEFLRLQYIEPGINQGKLDYRKFRDDILPLMRPVDSVPLPPLNEKG